MALLLEPLSLEYIRATLAQDNVESVSTPEGEVMYKLGRGYLKVLMSAGFSLYSYRLVNSMVLMLSESTRDSRLIRVPGESTLSEVTMYMYFPVNKFAYSRLIVSDRRYRRSMLDELGNLVLSDMLTLRSTSSSSLHNIVNYLRPDVLMLLYTDQELSRYTVAEVAQPVLYVASHARDVEETLLEHLSRMLPSFKVGRLEYSDLQLPHSHFFLELAASLVLVMIVPYSLEAVPYICNCITNIVTSIVRLSGEIMRLRERELRDRKEVILAVRPPLNVRKLARILEQHGFAVSIRDESSMSVAYYGNVPLHRMLIEDRLIEEYFSVKILSPAETQGGASG